MMCLNEAWHLSRNLSEVSSFAEWIVLDTGSTDETIQIAAESGACVRSVPWMGFSETRRLHFAMATQPWILWIDADEEVTAELVSELRELFIQEPVHDAYRVNRIMFFEGKWIRRGEWYPDRVTRLFKADCWLLEPRSVHESVMIRGSVGELHGELPHFSYRDWNDRNQRIRKYASLWARQELDRGRDTFKAEAVGRAIWRFFRAGILRKGFLDGRLGFQIAHSCAMEVHLKYLALIELRKISKLECEGSER
jgi:glycosyltransferase involved in cell wall biosynthesis